MPTTCRPIHYLLEITPDLTNFQFKGHVTIRLHADSPEQTVQLNALELAVWQARLETEKGWQLCAFSLNPDDETLTIDLGRTVEGVFNLQVSYEGRINDQMAGFYRSFYQRNGQSIPIAVTQFQESAARRAFPCMDHPLYKAVFELSLIIPKHLTALSNTHPLSTAMVWLDQQAPAPSHKKVVFAPTPKMSTYLLFFGVGDFHIDGDNQDPRVRVCHLPGLADTTDLGKNFGRKALRFCENYYGIPYPLKKMDLIAVPDFAFGAMENWGAITFRENLLLRFAGITSKAGTQRICEIIAHEIAHQWFGNLATPSDWKYLWLNESFATFFGYGVVDHYHPRWSVWDHFISNETGTALARDGLEATIAIEMPEAGKMAINSSTAPIIYNKGASIMRMIKGHIGENHFRNGVHTYLKNHSYACARSNHLWEAFEQASGQPVTAVMQNWISQPGYPVIKVARKNGMLELTQKRFSYRNKDSHQTWMIPITLAAWDATGRQHLKTHLMASASDTLALPEGTAAYKLNAGQTGFYRVAYQDDVNLKALSGLIASGQMPEADRWGLQDDLYAFARQASQPFSDYLDLLKAYADEHHFLPLTGICNHLQQALVAAPEGCRETIRAAGRKLSEQALTRIGYEPDDNEPQSTTLLRDQLLWQAVLWESAEATQFAEAQFDRLSSGHDTHPDITRAIMQAGARLRGDRALEWLSERFRQSQKEHERLNILSALGAFRHWPLCERALGFVLNNVPQRNRFVTIAAASLNPDCHAFLWPWYQDNRKALEQFHPLLYERVITSVWSYGGIPHEKEVHDFAEHYLKRNPSLNDAGVMALENLTLNSGMRRRLECR